jgi:hypothetical protein
MDDREAHEFCKDPEHLRITGPGRRRKMDELTEVKSVRFSGRMLAQVETAAGAEGRSVGSWIRKAVSFELIRLSRERRERPMGLIPGSGRKGDPKALRSSLSLGQPRTFSCEHMSISGVQCASCSICGPLPLTA